MFQEALALLSTPFDESLIKTRPIPGGKQLSYVSTHHYIERLNNTLGGMWSFTVKDSNLLEKSVLVLGRLEITDLESGKVIVKEGYGGALIKTSNKTGEPLDLPNDYKAASSDALKKCCALLGIGKELYENKEDEGRGFKKSEGQKSSNGDQISDGQIKFIDDLGGKKKLSKEVMYSLIETTIGKKVTSIKALTKEEAKKIIEVLKA